MSSVSYEDITPLRVSRRKALLAEITDRVGGMWWPFPVESPSKMLRVISVGMSR
jgi:hypothetical protein